ncbi:hypothetical protein F5Y12DRAFT_645126 [Xylaria sp. FL1777]|nr:hypothetical protein F5Y12DRAFT_645126 [Xylaria sp. FL1777]
MSSQGTHSPPRIRVIWSPPPDPNKPECPYLPGFIFNVSEHEPPPPFGPGGGSGAYPPSRLPVFSNEWLRTTPQTQQVLQRPPEETQWPSASLPRTAIFTINHAITIGNARGAQVVAGYMTEQGQEWPHLVTAKIFDSLYYPSVDDLANVPSSATYWAEKDYSRESAAYRHLEADEARQKPGFAPKYYGSWTFELPLSSQGKTHTRRVRLILIEYLDGSSMLDLFAKNSSGPMAGRDAFHYNLDYRLSIFAELLDGVQRQEHSGLDQVDLSPRNVIIVPSPKKTTLPPGQSPRVVLVDYNISVVFSQTKYAPMYKQAGDRPINPAQQFWTLPPDDFGGWIPAEWYDDTDDNSSYHEWLLSNFGGENASHYEPLVIEERKRTEVEAHDGSDDENFDWDAYYELTGIRRAPRYIDSPSPAREASLEPLQSELSPSGQ